MTDQPQSNATPTAPGAKHQPNSTAGWCTAPRCGWQAEWGTTDYLEAFVGHLADVKLADASLGTDMVACLERLGYTLEHRDYPNDVRRWAEDEAEAYREHGGFQEGRDAVQDVRRAKLAGALAENREEAIAEAKFDAWRRGHESGFWNGRQSAGHGEMKLVGIEHGNKANPHRQESK